MVKHKKKFPSKRPPALDRQAIDVLSSAALSIVGGGFGLGEPPVQQPGNPGVVAEGEGPAGS